MKKITIISLGSWGIALAAILNDNGHAVTLWGRNDDKVNEVIKTRKHSQYLTDFYIDEKISITSSIKEACLDTDIFISTTPSKGLRETMNNFKPYINEGAYIVNAAKGLEDKSLFTLSQVLLDIFPTAKIAALSGPGHAEEVSRKLPTAYAVASTISGVAEEVQDLFMNSSFRVYTTDDMIGMELGGALKNVIALAAGISDGLGYGDNAKAALMTRGIHEIANLGLAIGGNRATFSGLSGIGDLIVTCTSMHSRNRRAGILLGQGKSLEDTLLEINMVVEGVHTAKAAYDLGIKYAVDLPIVNEVNKVLFQNMSPKKAVNNLMGREKTTEINFVEPKIELDNL